MTRYLAAASEEMTMRHYEHGQSRTVTSTTALGLPYDFGCASNSVPLAQIDYVPQDAGPYSLAVPVDIPGCGWWGTMSHAEKEKILARICVPLVDAEVDAKCVFEGRHGRRFYFRVYYSPSFGELVLRFFQIVLRLYN